MPAGKPANCQHLAPKGSWPGFGRKRRGHKGAHSTQGASVPKRRDHKGAHSTQGASVPKRRGHKGAPQHTGRLCTQAPGPQGSPTAHRAPLYPSGGATREPHSTQGASVPKRRDHKGAPQHTGRLCTQAAGPQAHRTQGASVPKRRLCPQHTGPHPSGGTTREPTAHRAPLYPSGGATREPHSTQGASAPKRRGHKGAPQHTGRLCTQAAGPQGSPQHTGRLCTQAAGPQGSPQHTGRHASAPKAGPQGSPTAHRAPLHPSGGTTREPTAHRAPLYPSGGATREPTAHRAPLHPSGGATREPTAHRAPLHPSGGTTREPHSTQGASVPKRRGHKGAHSTQGASVPKRRGHKGAPQHTGRLCTQAAGPRGSPTAHRAPLYPSGGATREPHSTQGASVPKRRDHEGAPQHTGRLCTQAAGPQGSPQHTGRLCTQRRGHTPQHTGRLCTQAAGPQGSPTAHRAPLHPSGGTTREPHSTQGASAPKRRDHKGAPQHTGRLCTQAAGPQGSPTAHRAPLHPSGGATREPHSTPHRAPLYPSGGATREPHSTQGASVPKRRDHKGAPQHTGRLCTQAAGPQGSPTAHRAPLYPSGGATREPHSTQGRLCTQAAGPQGSPTAHRAPLYPSGGATREPHSTQGASAPKRRDHEGAPQHTGRLCTQAAGPQGSPTAHRAPLHPSGGTTREPHSTQGASAPKRRDHKGAPQHTGRLCTQAAGPQGSPTAHRAPLYPSGGATREPHSTQGASAPKRRGHKGAHSTQGASVPKRRGHEGAPQHTGPPLYPSGGATREPTAHRAPLYPSGGATAGSPTAHRAPLHPSGGTTREPHSTQGASVPKRRDHEGAPQHTGRLCTQAAGPQGSPTAHRAPLHPSGGTTREPHSTQGASVPKRRGHEGAPQHTGRLCTQAAGPPHSREPHSTQGASVPKRRDHEGAPQHTGRLCTQGRLSPTAPKRRLWSHEGTTREPTAHRAQASGSPTAAPLGRDHKGAPQHTGRLCTQAAGPQGSPQQGRLCTQAAGPQGSPQHTGPPLYPSGGATREPHSTQGACTQAAGPQGSPQHTGRLCTQAAQAPQRGGTTREPHSTQGRLCTQAAGATAGSPTAHRAPLYPSGGATREPHSTQGASAPKRRDHGEPHSTQGASVQATGRLCTTREPTAHRAHEGAPQHTPRAPQGSPQHTGRLCTPKRRGHKGAPQHTGRLCTQAAGPQGSPTAHRAASVPKRRGHKGAPQHTGPPLYPSGGATREPTAHRPPLYPSGGTTREPTAHRAPLYPSGGTTREPHSTQGRLPRYSTQGAPQHIGRRPLRGPKGPTNEERNHQTQNKCEFFGFYCFVRRRFCFCTPFCRCLGLDLGPLRGQAVVRPGLARLPGALWTQKGAPCCTQTALERTQRANKPRKKPPNTNQMRFSVFTALSVAVFGFRSLFLQLFGFGSWTFTGPSPGQGRFGSVAGGAHWTKTGAPSCTQTALERAQKANQQRKKPPNTKQCVFFGFTALSVAVFVSAASFCSRWVWILGLYGAEPWSGQVWFGCVLDQAGGLFHTDGLRGPQNKGRKKRANTKQMRFFGFHCLVSAPLGMPGFMARRSEQNLLRQDD